MKSFLENVFTTLLILTCFVIYDRNNNQTPSSTPVARYIDVQRIIYDTVVVYDTIHVEVNTEQIKRVREDTLVSSNSLEFEDLVWAIMMVEGGGRMHPKEISGCMGPMQQTRIFVRSVNNKNPLKNITYTYADRADMEKSKEMCRIWCRYKDPTLTKWEWLSRKYNGGVNGHKMESTKEYWRRIKKYLKIRDITKYKNLI